MRLLLLRHAKSDWSDAENTDDHDRPLSPRGREAAPRMGAYIQSHGYGPALVLSSSARRTKETVKLLLPQFVQRPDLRYTRALYLAEWPSLLEEVRKVPSPSSPLLIVGHNPGMQQFALALSLQPQSAAEKARAQLLAQKFPTAALAVFDFEGADWSHVKPGAGRLADFMRPKDLPGTDS